MQGHGEGGNAEATADSTPQRHQNQVSRVATIGTLGACAALGATFLGLCSEFYEYGEVNFLSLLCVAFPAFIVATTCGALFGMVVGGPINRTRSPRVVLALLAAIPLVMSCLCGTGLLGSRAINDGAAATTETEESAALRAMLAAIPARCAAISERGNCMIPLGLQARSHPGVANRTACGHFLMLCDGVSTLERSADICLEDSEVLDGSIPIVDEPTPTSMLTVEVVAPTFFAVMGQAMLLPENRSRRPTEICRHGFVVEAGLVPQAVAANQPRASSPPVPPVPEPAAAVVEPAPPQPAAAVAAEPMAASEGSAAVDTPAPEWVALERPWSRLLFENSGCDEGAYDGLSATSQMTWTSLDGPVVQVSMRLRSTDAPDHPIAQLAYIETVGEWEGSGGPRVLFMLGPIYQHSCAGAQALTGFAGQRIDGGLLLSLEQLPQRNPDFDDNAPGHSRRAVLMWDSATGAPRAAAVWEGPTREVPQLFRAHPPRR